MKKAKYILITDTKTKKKYSYPNTKKYPSFKEFVHNNDESILLCSMLYDPLSGRWWLASTTNGIMDDHNLALNRRFTAKPIYNKK